MRVHVALTPAEFPDATLDGAVALAVDVLRATTHVGGRLRRGLRARHPGADAGGRPASAGRARSAPDTCCSPGSGAAKRIAGFDLGNSPARVHARSAWAAAPSSSPRPTAPPRCSPPRGRPRRRSPRSPTSSAAARWAAAQGRDVTVLCAGDNGAFSLEDAVCAGLLVERLLAAARRAAALARPPQAARAWAGTTAPASSGSQRGLAAGRASSHRRGPRRRPRACVPRHRDVEPGGAGVRQPGAASLPRPPRRPTAAAGRSRARVNLPIALTLFRIVLVPPIMVFLISSDRVSVLIAAGHLRGRLAHRLARRAHGAAVEPGHQASAPCSTRWPTSSWSPPRWCRSCTWTWSRRGSPW